MIVRLTGSNSQRLKVCICMFADGTRKLHRRRESHSISPCIPCMAFHVVGFADVSIMSCSRWRSIISIKVAAVAYSWESVADTACRLYIWKF